MINIIVIFFIKNMKMFNLLRTGMINGIYKNIKFNKSTASEIIEIKLSSSNDIFLFLKKKYFKDNKLQEFSIKEFRMDLKYKVYETLKNDHCCDFHEHFGFRPDKCNDV